MQLVRKIVFHSILEIFYSISFWHLPYSIPKFPFHSIFHFIPCSEYNTFKMYLTNADITTIVFSLLGHLLCLAIFYSVRTERKRKKFNECTDHAHFSRITISQLTRYCGYISINQNGGSRCLHYYTLHSYSALKAVNHPANSGGLQ